MQTLEAQTGSEQYLTFILGDEEYGVPVLRVQEIRGWEKPTAVPNMPDYIPGVMNLRGGVVPIVDLRRLFSLPGVEFGQTTAVIVVKALKGRQERTMGLVVDAVSDVCNIAQEQIRPSVDLGGAAGTAAVQGLMITDNGMIILLDIDALIDTGIITALTRDRSR